MKDKKEALYKGFKNQSSIIGRLDMVPVKNFFGGPIKIELTTLHPIKNLKTGNFQEHVERHTVVLQNGLLEFFLKHAQKGRMFFAQGPIQTQIFEKSNGRVIQTTELIADVFGPFEGQYHV